MNKRVEEYLNLPYSTYVIPDVTTDNEPCYMAYHPELEGCMSHGDTLEEAVRNLREATELYIITLIDRGIKIPLPQGVGLRWAIVGSQTQRYADEQASASVAQL